MVKNLFIYSINFTLAASNLQASKWTFNSNTFCVSTNFRSTLSLYSSFEYPIVHIKK